MGRYSSQVAWRSSCTEREPPRRLYILAISEIGLGHNTDGLRDDYYALYLAYLLTDTCGFQRQVTCIMGFIWR